MMDRVTSRPRGFAFVTMSTDEEAQKAIDGLNGKELSGRALSVNIARPRESSPGGRGPGRREFGGGNRGGGGAGVRVAAGAGATGRAGAGAAGAGADVGLRAGTGTLTGTATTRGGSAVPMKPSSHS